jgi:poly-beta-1,6-N-acetyl-D-glucosamine synthase
MKKTPLLQTCEEEGNRTDPPLARLSVTVIIPAHNEAENITGTVRSCLGQTYLPETVIVVDDGSTDNTGELAREAGATVLRGPGGSKSRAQNIALEHVTTDLIVGVDADTLLAPDAIEHMVATINEGYDGTCAAVFPQQGKGLFVRSRKFEYALAKRWHKPIQNALAGIFVLSGCALCYKTDAVRSIGGMPIVPIGDDLFLTWAFHMAGYRLSYTPQATCYTKEPENFRTYRGQVRRWAADFYQVISQYKKEMWKKPGLALVVATTIWDFTSISAAYALLVIFRASILNFLWLEILSGWLLVYFGIIIFLASRDLGWKEPFKCLPARIIVSQYTRWVYVWAMIREWFLGRHYGSWTGRLGSKSKISPMSLRRKFALMGSGSAAMGYFGATIIAGVITTNVVTTGEDPFQGVTFGTAKPAFEEVLGTASEPQADPVEASADQDLVRTWPWRRAAPSTAEQEASSHPDRPSVLTVAPEPSPAGPGLEPSSTETLGPTPPPTSKPEPSLYPSRSPLRSEFESPPSSASELITDPHLGLKAAPPVNSLTPWHNSWRFTGGGRGTAGDASNGDWRGGSDRRELRRAGRVDEH